jgi:hypothetical protein
VGHSLARATRGGWTTRLPIQRLADTVVTDLLEVGEAEHVVESVTGQLSWRRLEHYAHQRLKAKGQMLARMKERRKKVKRLNGAGERRPLDLALDLPKPSDSKRFGTTNRQTPTS